jgi:hypothetical protein
LFSWRSPLHPFVQYQLPSSDTGATRLRSPVAGALLAIVSNHVVQGRVIFPGAGYLEMGRAAAASASDRSCALRSVFFLQPLAVEAAGLLIEVAIDDGHFEVRSRSDDALTDAVVHCTGESSWKVINITNIFFNT